MFKSCLCHLLVDNLDLNLFPSNFPHLSTWEFWEGSMSSFAQHVSLVVQVLYSQHRPESKPTWSLFSRNLQVIP